MTASTSLILTCRLRSRVHPHHSEMQATKPKNSVAFKTRMEPQEKLSVLSEDTSRWPSIKETQTSSLDSEFEERPSIFRQRAEIDEAQEDMFVLKRANPVYDSDEEDDLSSYCSPSKRQRTDQVLQWGDKVSDGNVGFSLHL
jgi:hypothetical protein